MRSLSMVLVISFMAVGSAFAAQPEADTPTVPDSSVTTPSCAEPVSEPVSEPPILPASAYTDCLASYIDCVNGCQGYPQPTRTQCENWCFHHHWCVQV